MTDLMKQVVLAKGELSDEERNLLSVGYKNTIGSRRSAWRVVENMEQESEGPKLSVIKVFLLLNFCVFPSKKFKKYSSSFKYTYC